MQYRVTEPDHSAAYTDQLYRAAADGSSDVPVNYDDCILWKGTDKEIQKFVIVNTMETVSLSISKNWDGEDAVTDSEALRPEQIDFKVEYTVSGSDDWKSLPAGIYETETAGEAVTVSEGGLVSVHAPEWKMTLQGLAKTDGTGAAYQYGELRKQFFIMQIQKPLLYLTVNFPYRKMAVSSGLQIQEDMKQNLPSGRMQTEISLYML